MRFCRLAGEGWPVWLVRAGRCWWQEANGGPFPSPRTQPSIYSSIHLAYRERLMDLHMIMKSA
eukprot:91111-Chlamydomonas_euryale.AAC.8